MTKTESTHQFQIEHTFDAPRDVVFKVWTQPEHLKNWSGPKGFLIEYKKADVKPEGIAHYVMTTPEGAQMWGMAIYKEIRFPHRIVYLQHFSDKNQGVTRHPLSSTWPMEMLTTVLFAEEDDGTKITLTWQPVNANDIEIETFENSKDGMKQGWGGTFENLEKYLKTL